MYGVIGVTPYKSTGLFSEPRKPCGTPRYFIGLLYGVILGFPLEIESLVHNVSATGGPGPQKITPYLCTGLSDTPGGGLGPGRAQEIESLGHIITPFFYGVKKRTVPATYPKIVQYHNHTVKV